MRPLRILITVIFGYILNNKLLLSDKNSDTLINHL